MWPGHGAEVGRRSPGGKVFVAQEPWEQKLALVCGEEAVFNLGLHK